MGKAHPTTARRDSTTHQLPRPLVALVSQPRAQGDVGAMARRMTSAPWHAGARDNWQNRGGGRPRRKMAVPYRLLLFGTQKSRALTDYSFSRTGKLAPGPGPRSCFRKGNGTGTDRHRQRHRQRQKQRHRQRGRQMMRDRRSQGTGDPHLIDAGPRLRRGPLQTTPFLGSRNTGPYRLLLFER